MMSDVWHREGHNCVVETLVSMLHTHGAEVVPQRTSWQGAHYSQYNCMGDGLYSHPSSFTWGLSLANY